MAVARHAKVVRLPDVRAELEGVVALDLRPIVDELDLLLIFDQWAIAAIHPKRIAKLEGCWVAVAVDEKRRHARVEVSVDVQARDPGILCRRCASAIRLH